MKGRVCAWAILTLVPAALSAQDTQWNRYTLENLEGVFLRTEATPACIDAGIVLADVERSATALLGESDIVLLTAEAVLKTPGFPELRLSLDCSERSDAMAYTVSIRVQQSAQMVRNPQITLPEAVTWFATSVGVADVARSGEAIEDSLEAKLQEFATAWAAANAAETPPGGD